MVVHQLTCEQCKKQIPYALIRFNAHVTCPHCHTSYYVNKSYFIYMVELLLLFFIGAILFNVLSLSPMDATLSMVLLFIILLVIYLLLDILFVKVFRYRKMYMLVKKEKER